MVGARARGQGLGKHEQQRASAGLGPGHEVLIWSCLRCLSTTQVRLLLAGSSELEDPQALEGAARALRSLLVLEVRSANLQASRLSPSRPPYLSPGLDCAACDVTGASGASFPAMVAAPASALRKPWVLALALAHTLAADAMHLQFRVPDVPPPASWAALERDAAPSHRLPATEVVAITSVWAANVLRQYSSGSLPHAARILLSLGVIKVPSSAAPLFHSAHVRGSRRGEGN